MNNVSAHELLVNLKGFETTSFFLSKNLKLLRKESYLSFEEIVEKIGVTDMLTSNMKMLQMLHGY